MVKIPFQREVSIICQATGDNYGNVFSFKLKNEIQNNGK